MEPRASRTVTLGALCFLILTGLPTKAQAGCPTVRLFGSASLYPPHLLVSTYSMTSPATPGTRPEYRNDESKAPVFFDEDYWHIENENRIRVRDSSFYLEDITGTFEIWDRVKREFVPDTEAHFSCADITYICKDDKKTIRCPRPDFQKILIVRAAYGQDWLCKLSGCTEREGECTSCYWNNRNDVMATVKERCTRAPGSCILEPSDEMFGGNPCDHIEGDVDTYLRVEHRCINVPLSLGCYQDEPVNKPLLTGPSVSHVNTTIQKCLKYCRAQSYRYAGVVNRFGCRCGNQLQQDSASRRLLITDCTAPCGGDDFQFCGGPSTSQKIEVFETSIGACGGDLKSNEGIIYSPDFPGPYPLDQNCVWNIQVAPEKVIRVKLELLDITTEDNLTIVEGNSSSAIVTFLNGTSGYVSFSSYVRLQFRAGPRRAQQTNGFILRYEGVGHCGDVTANNDVISVSPNHGRSFTIGQRVTITCKNGQNVTVLCQKNGTFDIPTPYCSETTTDRGQDVVAWAAPVSVLGAVLLVSIGVFAIFIVKRRRAAKEPGTSTHDYDMVDPGTDDNDEYEMVDTRDSRPPAMSPQAAAVFPPPPGAYGARSDSADYQALDPSTMGNTDSEYTSLTTNRAHPDYENNHEYLDLSSQTTNRVRTDDSDYENDFEYEDTI